MSQSTKSTTNEQGLLAIFKGDSGSGKSVGALSFPSAYVWDFDRKMPSIAQKHFPNKDIHFDTFNDIFEVEKQLQEFVNHCPYETLIVDSFTSLGNLIIHSVGNVKGETVPSLLGKTKGGAIEMMGIDYYNAEDRFMTYFIDKLKTLWARQGNPRHIIVIAHVVTVESAPDLKTKIITRTRSILAKGRKPGAWLPTGFDNVYIFGHELPDMSSIGGAQGSVKRIVKTEAFGEDSAKCSFPFPGTIDFTNGNLYEILCKKYNLNLSRLELPAGETVIEVTGTLG